MTEFEQAMAEHIQDKIADLKRRIARDMELDRRDQARIRTYDSDRLGPVTIPED